ncbi:3-oxoacyl-[acyl-carrier protein] reductase [Thermocatellispora tengchongensis]|uniref:3-oxoacyl-[acyl-carrier protein] reductase n=1 Tax=Thermocatellispora tengchongensis TaxID=1073253 RepID=A0A840P8X1_9ACTN|nr:SDR family NAD(P)-dependent oxidoreductase [Thermocatellispora tengchongensis]MBB5137824.1 3-oxoacyl-[acyl-carrier protein] reductase [Thermocatellispora tengchongensis]
MKQNLLSMQGRVALVTGAGQGVGRAVALHFAAHDARAVVVNDFYEERAEKTAEEVRAQGTEALPLAFDVTDYAQVADAFARVGKEYGQLHALVNNAGNAGPGGRAGFSDFWSEEPSDWERWLGTNLYGVFNCVRHGVPLMREHGTGRVVTVISDAGRQGEPGLEVYSAAKAGAAGFTRAVARSTGRFGITANAVSISATRTPFVADMLADEEAAKAQLKRYIIRRFGEPEDVANMVLFLSSHASSWVTGQTIPVNGGYSVAL